MLQTVTTMVSMLLSAGAAGVIAASLREERRMLRMALAGAAPVRLALPPRTHRIAGPRAARFIRLAGAPQPLRAAA